MTNKEKKLTQRRKGAKGAKKKISRKDAKIAKKKKEFLALRLCVMNLLSVLCPFASFA
jgi:hypothetical protein